jgi:isoleucyl-tRNA synthetase
MADAPDTTKTDYRSTVFLPRTDFPMKAGLPQREPAILARWESEGLYQKIRENRAGRKKFIFHDGPPYANGDIHIGHALNHAIKDMVVRTQTLLGKDAPYVPGWDCHGLPIEWKVEEQYRKKKLNKDEVPVREFRAECRAYAQHWVDVQRDQLKRLGVSANWDKPYLTMNFHAEATIVSELFKFAQTGQLYRGAKPVMWSPVEKTALAEAEIEYEDIVSTQIDVAFEIVESPIAELVGTYGVVWTTTPWTIPVNQAVAYNPEVGYALVQDRNSDRRYLVAEELMRSPVGSAKLKMAANFGPVAGAARVPSSPARLSAIRCTSSAGSSPSRGRSCRATSSPPTRELDSSTWRPTMARTISNCAAPMASIQCSQSTRAASTDPTGFGSAGRARLSTPSSMLPTARSARTCARPEC